MSMAAILPCSMAARRDMAQAGRDISTSSSCERRVGEALGQVEINSSLVVASLVLAIALNAADWTRGGTWGQSMFTSRRRSDCWFFFSRAKTRIAARREGSSAFGLVAVLR